MSQVDAVFSVGSVVRNVVLGLGQGPRVESCAAVSPRIWLFWKDNAVGLRFRTPARAEEMPDH